MGNTSPVLADKKTHALKSFIHAGLGHLPNRGRIGKTRGTEAQVYLQKEVA